ncbi:hypothetical protein ACOSQ3_028381 [Xanthoceras sorbifolium]
MESPCSWPENSSSDRRKAIEELLKGRDLALELRRLLNKLSSSSSAENNNNNDDDDDDDNNDGVLLLNQDLVPKILTSFTNTLSILKNSSGGGEYQSDEVVSQVQTNAPHLSWDTIGRKSEDSSGDSCKSTLIVKDKRGCYKRRKCSDSWTKDSSTLVDDGHAWRKYGQKVILNAKYPRNYFRCTHKHDQKCMATKQVQRIQEDPPLFRTNYYGQHTCKNLLKASQLFMDTRYHDNCPMISFCDKENNYIINNNSNSNNPFVSSFSSVKREYQDEQEIMPSHYDHHRHDLTHNNNQTESSDHCYILSPDDHHHHHQQQHLTTYDSGVVNSSSLSCTDMGVMVVDSVDNFDADDLFEFC